MNLKCKSLTLPKSNVVQSHKECSKQFIEIKLKFIIKNSDADSVPYPLAIETQMVLFSDRNKIKILLEKSFFSASLWRTTKK